MSYQKINIAGFRFRLSSDFPAGGGFAGDYNVPIADGQRSSFARLSSSKFARVFKFDIIFKGKIYGLILKQYLNRGLSDVLKNFLLPCRAQRAFKAGLMLKKNGFLTPEIAAMGEKIFAANFLVTAEVKNAVSLPELLNKSMPEKHQLVRQFAQTVGKMHDKNIFHGDLRLGNVLVKSADSKFDFYFLDNERTKKFRKLPDRLRLKNLVQINMFRENISNSDRMRFFKEYLKQQNVKLNAGDFAARIITRTSERLAAKEIRTA